MILFFFLLDRKKQNRSPYFMNQISKFFSQKLHMRCKSNAISIQLGNKHTARVNDSFSVPCAALQQSYLVEFAVHSAHCFFYDTASHAARLFIGICVACHNFMLSSSESSEKGGMANCFSVTSIQATVVGFSDPHDRRGLLTYMRRHAH